MLLSKQKKTRDLNTDSVNQSFRILANLVAAGTQQSGAAVDDMITVLLEFTAAIVRLQLCDAYSLILKSLSLLKKLLDNSGGRMGSSYYKHWVTLKQLYSQIVFSIKDASGRIFYEATACMSVMLSRVALGHKRLMSTEDSAVISLRSSVEETLVQIVDHAKTSGVVELLSECLTTSGLSLMSGSSSMVPAACEACKSIWYLIDAHEIISAKGQTRMYPLNLSRSGHDQSSPRDAETAILIKMFVKFFLESKPLQLAIYHCFHNGLESALIASLQTENSPYQYRGMFHALGTVYRQEGFRALYKGWLPSVIGSVHVLNINTSIIYFAEMCKGNDKKGA